MSGLDEMPSSLKEPEEIPSDAGGREGTRIIGRRWRRRNRRLSDLVIGVISLITCNLLNSVMGAYMVSDPFGYSVYVFAIYGYGICGLFYLYQFIVGRRVGRRYTYGYRRGSRRRRRR